MLPSHACIATLYAQLVAMEEHRQNTIRVKQTDQERHYMEESLRQMIFTIKDMEAGAKMEAREKELSDAKSEAGTQERKAAEAKQKAAWASFKAQDEHDLHAMQIST
jgi:hypothetical protein